MWSYSVEYMLKNSRTGGVLLVRAGGYLAARSFGARGFQGLRVFRTKADGICYSLISMPVHTYQRN